jgi:hypothetical protein
MMMNFHPDTQIVVPKNIRVLNVCTNIVTSTTRKMEVSSYFQMQKRYVVSFAGLDIVKGREANYERMFFRWIGYTQRQFRF